jgi:predicted lipoprotein with Yx(FWY)xxD motif
VAASVVLAACGSSSKKASNSTTTVSPANPTTTVASGAPAAGGATLAAATNSKLGKQIVVDSAGNTVYLFVPDGTSKTSTVPSAVKANWPAVKGPSAAPTVGAGLDQSKVAVNMQADGTDQVSYGGHLLYTFSGDKAPGDANGQGLGGNWYVLSPAGDKIS